MIFHKRSGHVFLGIFLIALFRAPAFAQRLRFSDTLVDGPGQLTYTRYDGIHVCPEGYALAGVNVDKKLFICRRMPEAATDYFIDTGTTRNGIRACPAETYIRGLVERPAVTSERILVCAYDRERGYTQFAGPEVPDICAKSPTACTQQDGNHVCGEKSVMTSYRGQNIYLCRPVPVFPDPISNPVKVEFDPSVHRSFQRLRWNTSLEAWQTLTTNWLNRILNRPPDQLPQSVPFSPMEPAERMINGVRQVHVQYPSPRDQRMIEAWISYPPDYDPNKKYPAVFVTHGHLVTLANTSDPSRLKTTDHAIAYELALNGAITLAAEVRGFGSFAVHDGHDVYASTILPGHYPQQYIRDNLMSVSQLLSIKGVDPARTAVVGLSLGGYQSLWLGALDKRIRKVVVAGLFLSQECLNDPNWHHGCQTVPSIKDLTDDSALIDTEDLAALIAPRSLLITWGTSDPFYMWNPNKTCRINAYERTARLYDSLNIADHLAYAEFDGKHEIDVKDTVNWVLNTPFY